LRGADLDGDTEQGDARFVDVGFGHAAWTFKNRTKATLLSSLTP
jgi:hypothetical protein